MTIERYQESTQVFDRNAQSVASGDQSKSMVDLTDRGSYDSVKAMRQSTFSHDSGIPNMFVVMAKAEADGGVNSDEISAQSDKQRKGGPSDSKKNEGKTPEQLAGDIETAVKNYRLKDAEFQAEISRAFKKAYETGGYEAARALAGDINKNMKVPFGPVVFSKDSEGRQISNGVDVQFFMKDEKGARPISDRLRVSLDDKADAGSNGGKRMDKEPPADAADGQKYERARMHRDRPMAWTPKGDWEVLEPQKTPDGRSGPKIINVELRDGKPYGRTTGGDWVPLVRKK